VVKTWARGNIRLEKVRHLLTLGNPMSSKFDINRTHGASRQWGPCRNLQCIAGGAGTLPYVYCHVLALRGGFTQSRCWISVATEPSAYLFNLINLAFKFRALRSLGRRSRRTLDPTAN
jgi:hypothetical protein